MSDSSDNDFEVDPALRNIDEIETDVEQPFSTNTRMGVLTRDEIALINKYRRKAKAYSTSIQNTIDRLKIEASSGEFDENQVRRTSRYNKYVNILQEIDKHHCITN